MAMPVGYAIYYHCYTHSFTSMDIISAPLNADFDIYFDFEIESICTYWFIEFMSVLKAIIPITIKCNYFLNIFKQLLHKPY